MGIAYRYYDKVYDLSFCTCHKDKHKNNEESRIKIGKDKSIIQD